jgi:hypothetical protein
MWPYEEDDHMELGETGWVAIGEGVYMNKLNNHTMDEIGREFDENGRLIYDPNEEQ